MQVEQTRFDIILDMTTEEGQQEAAALAAWFAVNYEQIKTFKIDYSNYSKPTAEASVWFKNEEIAMAFKVAWS